MTHCLKCQAKIRYALPANRVDGGKDYILRCESCGYTFSIQDKADEVRERERKRLKDMFGEKHVSLE